MLVKKIMILLLLVCSVAPSLVAMEVGRQLLRGAVVGSFGAGALICAVNPSLFKRQPGVCMQVMFLAGCAGVGFEGCSILTTPSPIALLPPIIKGRLVVPTIRAATVKPLRSDTE